MSTTETQTKKETLQATNADPAHVGEAIIEAAVEKGKVIQRAEKFIYVGPPTKQLPKYALYEGGLPAAATDHFEKCPALKALFIDPKKLNAFQMKLLDGNSVETMFYKKAEEYLSEVK